YVMELLLFCTFFFQAEDGIRDRNVTGVQTCALPISSVITYCPNGLRSARCGTLSPIRLKSSTRRSTSASRAIAKRCSTALVDPQIGRASCRERKSFEVYSEIRHINQMTTKYIHIPEW